MRANLAKLRQLPAKDSSPGTSTFAQTKLVHVCATADYTSFYRTPSLVANGQVSITDELNCSTSS